MKKYSKQFLYSFAVIAVMISFFSCTFMGKSQPQMYISKQPVKLNYAFGEELDLSGLEIKSHYYDYYYNNYDVVISDWTSTPPNGTRLLTDGKFTVKISFGKMSVSLDVMVGNKPDVFFIGESNPFFWGTWIRMDNGKKYEILEDIISIENESDYPIEISDKDSLAVQQLGTFKKESDSVIMCDNIPYFRSGGTNLDYSLKIVGFVSSSSRAASTLDMSGIQGIGKSSKYKTFKSESESDASGILRLNAPTINDPQTVTIVNGEEIVVVSGLTIANTGDYMGTIALVDKNDYSLKISGTISEDQKDYGYLYGNNFKSYDMELTIKNISNMKCESSICKIEPESTLLKLSSEENLDAFMISTMIGGAEKKIKIKVSFDKMTEAYVNTGIKIKLMNSQFQWEDYVPLRFYRGRIPITVATKSPEENNESTLNGFVIYPDGNSQFFSVPNNSSKVLYVPTFGTDKNYKMVFSGAKVTSNLSDSTEMFYSVAPRSTVKKDINLDTSDWTVIDGYMNYGGENHTEDTAFQVDSGFIAYLPEGEVDYYNIRADTAAD